MDVVLDSNIVNSLTKSGLRNLVSDLVKSRRLRVVVDKRRALIAEWFRTANPEIVEQLIIHWQDHGGFVILGLDAKIPSDLKRKLRLLRFKDAGDKVVVAVALMITDRRIITHDSDFWDPANRRSIGVPSAPVAKLLRDFYGINVHMLSELAKICPQ